MCSVDEAPDVFGGKYPGEMKMLAGPLETEQVAFSYRRMPQHSGGKGGYGHRHKTQEEVYFVVSGELQFKLDDDVIDVGAGTAVRIAPGTVRSVWNERPEEAVLLIVSTRSDDPRDDVELVEDFWPA
jgi:mannose-6-phosphate isomerase-like protein (cupin superfamily)